MCSFGKALSIERVNLPTWSLSKRLIPSFLIQSLPTCSALDFNSKPPSSASLAFFLVESCAHLLMMALSLGSHGNIPNP
jgi:hypothetical protein